MKHSQWPKSVFFSLSLARLAGLKWVHPNPCFWSWPTWRLNQASRTATQTTKRLWILPAASSCHHWFSLIFLLAVCFLCCLSPSPCFSSPLSTVQHMKSLSLIVLFSTVHFFFFSLIWPSPLCSDTDWRRNCLLVKSNMLAAICLLGKAQRKIYEWIYFYLPCTPWNHLLFSLF